MKSDQYFMEKALKEAGKALELKEVPIGAVVVFEDEVIGRGYNLKEKEQDPTAHAEMIAIRQAARKLGSWRLDGCQLFVTIEPCPMCAGAIVQARIERLVFGALDSRAGAAGSVYNIVENEHLNHRLNELKSGVLKEESRQLIRDFFKKLRS